MGRASAWETAMPDPMVTVLAGTEPLESCVVLNTATSAALFVQAIVGDEPLGSVVQLAVERSHVPEPPTPGVAPLGSQ